MLLSKLAFEDNQPNTSPYCVESYQLSKLFVGFYINGEVVLKEAYPPTA
jgi:hypothetical protein